MEIDPFEGIDMPERARLWLRLRAPIRRYARKHTLDGLLIRAIILITIAIGLYLVVF